MQEIKEFLEKKDMIRDSKARRVVNAAPGKACGITVEEIEKNGVTIERLESLSVPVFQYGGQVTIHGVFPETTESLRVAGYRSVFKNSNGSLGVRYAAIDADKKKRLCDLSHFKANGGFFVGMDSRGCHATKTFNDKQEALDCYRSVPDLYIGTKSIGVDFFGRFHVMLSIGAVYEKDFVALAEGLMKRGFHEMESDRAVEEKRRQEDRARFEAEYAKARAKNEEIRKDLMEKRKAIHEDLKKIYPVATALENGVFAVPCMSVINPCNRGVLVYVLVKGSFGRYFSTHAIVADAASVKSAVPAGEKKVVSDTFKKYMKDGQVFKVS